MSLILSWALPGASESEVRVHPHSTPQRTFTSPPTTSSPHPHHTLTTPHHTPTAPSPHPHLTPHYTPHYSPPPHPPHHTPTSPPTTHPHCTPHQHQGRLPTLGERARHHTENFHFITLLPPVRQVILRKYVLMRSFGVTVFYKETFNKA